MKSNDWHALSADAAANRLDTDLKRGLGLRAVRERLALSRNVITQESKSGWQKLLLAQFTDTMVIVLMAATLLSALLGDLLDAVTILTIVVLNGILGFFQEYRAERALAAIQKMSAPSAAVIRNGQTLRIPAEELVPGDLVLVEAGDRVPADLRLVQAHAFEVEESCITGESLPSAKQAEAVLPGDTLLGDRKNMVFMGTMATRGRALGVVVATGMETIMGEIASFIQQKKNEETPLQARLSQLGKVLIAVCVVACLMVVALGLSRGENLIRMLMAGISLAVAAIPEGLPAIVTVVLALGVQRMAERHAVVRKLSAVETLGCTTVICSDKTGTLTQNEMTVRLAGTLNRTWTVTGEGYQPEGNLLDENGRKVKPSADTGLQLLLETAAWCSHAEVAKEHGRWIVRGDPTEGALVVLGSKGGIGPKPEILREVPFDSDRKMMSMVVLRNGTIRICTKGALEALLPRCNSVMSGNRVIPLGRRETEKLNQRQQAWAQNALRVMAVAYRDLDGADFERMDDQQLESGLSLIGLCGMMDPPRPEVPAAVKQCVDAGITPIMITGDHPETAVAIARQIGMSQGTEVLGPHDIDQMGLKELAAKAVRVRVFARVSPHQKLKIVQALRSQGHVVAMTGDGVNDAPAVKEADIGIAMGMTGTEVTKEASAMVLADDNFATIVKAVHEGRGIYDNIRKFIRYLLGCNIGEVLTMFLASVIGLPLPMLPIQILWVNLVTDGLPAMALGLEKPEQDVMLRTPRRPDESVFSRGLGWRIAWRGVYIGITTLAALAAGLTLSAWAGTRDLALARTLAFTTLVFAQLFFVFECRSERYSPFEIGFFRNQALLAAVCCSVLMQLAVIYQPNMQRIFGTVPLEPFHWLIILLLTGSGFLFKFTVYIAGKLAGRASGYVKLGSVEIR
ncbi:MAG: calcium-translocating P-type ATPase, SERCA-type [Solirubrobacterales bacterium]